MDVLHPKVAEEAIQQALLFRVKIAFGLFLEHAEDVEPVLAGLEVQRTLSRRGVRHRTQRCRRICGKCREKIHKARRILRARNVTVIIGSGRIFLVIERYGIEIDVVDIRLRRIGLSWRGSRGLCFFYRSRIERYAFLYGSVRVELSTVRNLKTYFLLFVFTDHRVDFNKLRIACGTISSMSRSFDELIAVMQRLRAPGGCPWDHEQTYASLAQYLLEESYETFDAIQEANETGDTTHLREELGDLLLQVVFHSTIGAERGDFTIDDVSAGVTQKLILRHPHVFGDAKLAKAQDVLDNWDQLKADERAASGKPAKQLDSILDEVPVHFPGLLEALKVSKKAAKVGFDWESNEPIFEKITEETNELREAIHVDDKDHIAEEVGDLLFAVVNLARKLDIEPETALKKTNRKFRQRFKFIEDELKREGKTLEDSSLEEMDALWNAAKTGKTSHA